MQLFQRSIRVGIAIVCVGLFAACVGCAGGGRAKESEEAVGSMAETNAQLDQAKGTVNSVLRDLDRLSAGGGDLQSTFSTYRSDVAALQSAGEKAQKRWQDMQENANAYIAKWEQEAAQVDNPQVKAGMEQRRQRVRANYDRITSQARQTRAAYDPFLRDVQDIERALSVDLTPGGVNALQPAINQARADGTKLSRELDALHASISELQSGMTP